MELRFSPTEGDFLNIMRVSPGSGWNATQFLLSFIPIFFVGAAMVGADMPIGGWVCIALSLLIALAGYEIPRREWRKLARNAPSAKGERMFTLNDEGISVTFPMGKAQCEWGVFARYRETATLFVLFVSPRQTGSWIPKRAMSPEHMEQLRHILQSRLPTR